MAFRKESFINNRRQFKRHVTNQWMHGHAGRAVDGEEVRSLHSCTVLDNFYVEKPVWMVDLGRRTTISGVVILTWMNNNAKTNGNTRHYLASLSYFYYLMIHSVAINLCSIG